MKLSKTKAADLYHRKVEIEGQTKTLYRELDEIEGQLVAAIREAADHQIATTGGKKLILQDNFSNPDGSPKLKVWKQTCVSRWTVSEV